MGGGVLAGALLGPEAAHVLCVCVLVTGLHGVQTAAALVVVGVRKCGGCGVVFENCIVDASILMT